ncbi:uncharacterized protein [Dysidea avara]|uniref:uncharacterized protein n=1 Tax=Dysidea avara TaxID=196820 RepID=UPI0033299638
MQTTSGEDIAIVLDGYDELPEDARKNTKSFFIRLIHPDYSDLCKSMVVITSRLTVSVELHNIIERRVEILGFTKDNRKAYIRQALENESQATEELLAYLERNPAINAYCYIPLNMTILLCLFKEGGENTELPTTQTEINKKFICITISRFIITKQKEYHEGISDFIDIPDRYKPIFLELCQLAFQALCCGKIIFTKSEIQNVCKHLILHTGNWNGLGLLKAVEFYSMKENVKNVTFNFLHLSLQETLAAYHINLSPQQEQINLLKEDFLSRKYFNTWILYVGMTKGQSFPFKHFLSGNQFQLFTLISLWFSKTSGISKKLISNKVFCLHLFQCFSEAENDDMCQYVGELLQDKKIDLSDQTLSPVNIHTLSLFLSRSTTKYWQLLSLSNCHIGDAEIDLLYTFNSSSRNVHIDDLDLSYNNFSQSSATLLANLVLGWNIKRVVMHSVDDRRKRIDSDIIHNLIEHIAKIELVPNQMEIFITNQSFLVMYMQNYEAIIAALSSRNYSIIHLFSCTLGSTFNQTAEIAIMLAARSSKVCLHSCEVCFTHLLESVMKCKILSFHYIDERNLTSKEIEIAVEQLAGFTIKIGDRFFPLHVYHVTDKSLCTIKEEMFEGANQGTFVFKNCRGEDVHEIVSCCHSLSNWQYVMLNSEVTIRKSVSQQTTSILERMMCYCAGQAEVNIHTVEKSSALQHLSFLNCKLQSQEILVVIEAIHTITTLLRINLSGNNINNQIAEILANSLGVSIFLQHLELASCNLYEEGLVLVCSAIRNRQLLTLNLSGNCITDNVAGELAYVITSRGCIENLHLKRCSLKYHAIQMIIAALAQIKSLKYLDLSCNNMSYADLDVASVVLSNQSLENLNLSHCTLQEGTMSVIVKTINYANLKILNVSGNHVSDATACCMVVLLVNAVGLHGLCLSQCGLQENVLIRLMRNTNSPLKHLDVSYNAISDDAAKYVADLVLKSTMLTHLDLSNCGLQERGLALIVKAICKSTMLKYIDLKSNKLNDSLANEIAAFISDNHVLNNLCLSDCDLREEGLLRIVEALERTKLMQHLDISSTLITNKVASKLASTDLLFENSQLNYFNFSYCQWLPKSLSKILFAATNIYNLKYINCSGCMMNDEEARYLASSITVNDNLAQLILANCGLHLAGLMDIVVVLKKISTLKHLDLSYNQFSEAIITPLAEVISVYHLEHLSLSRCLQGVCSSDILTAIANSGTLQYLDLSYNGISDDEASCVASAISANKYLHHFNFTNNQFGSQSIKMILNAMATVTFLQFINLSSYSITDELTADLEQVASCNGRLESIFIYKYAIKKVKLEQVPISTSKLVLTKLCINDYTVADTEACTLESLISIISISSICHLDLANSVISDARKPRIIKAMRKHSALTHLNLSGISVHEEIEDELASLITNNGNLQCLELSDCKLRESFLCKLSVALNVHKKLLHLNLSFNTLSATAAINIAKVIAENVRLECLEIACCGLSETCLINVFGALSKLYRIIKLKLNGNIFSDYAAEIFTSVVAKNTDLKQIEVGDCKLSNAGVIKLTEVMKSSRLIELTDLNLNSSMITGQAVDNLHSVVVSCYKLKRLELSKCGLAGLRVFLCRTAYTLTTLTYLNLSNNHISEVCAGGLAILISTNTQLQHLNVSTCSLASEGVLKIVKALKRSTVLLHLDLGSNYLLEELDSVAAEIAVLITNNRAIEHLCLPHCEFQDKDLNIMLKAMKGTISYKCIDLGCNQISDSLYQHVTDIIASNHNLEVFKVFKLILSQRGLKQLNDMLPKFRALQVVSLHQCHVSDQQLSHFSVMVAKNPDITDFRITDCLLPDLDVCKVFSSLRFIKSLDLSYIELTDNSIEQVAAVIAASKNLDHLSLVNCRISESGIAKVLKALKGTTTLQHFTISNIAVNQQVENDMKLVIANNVKLRRLELVGCGLTENGTEKLGDALYRHESLLCIKLHCSTVRLKKSTLLNAIAMNTNVTQLEMSNCSLKETDIIALTETIKHGKHKQFAHINLSGNNLTVAATKSVLFMVSSCPLMKHLELCSCGMIIPSMELPETLNLDLFLSKLDLSHNPIGNEGAELVAAFISTSSKIVHVNLSNCNFQSSEINQLVKALKSISSLQFIDLSMNDTRNGTLVPIGPVISSNGSLSFLHLPIYNYTKEDLDNIFGALANVLSLKSKQGTQNSNCFASVAKTTNFTLQKLKVFEVDYNENAVGRLNNMQYILEYFNNSKEVVTPLIYCTISSFVPNCLIIEVGLCSTLKAVENAHSLEYLNFNNTPITDLMEYSMIAAIISNKTLLHLEMAACRVKDTGLSSAISSCAELEGLNLSDSNISIVELAPLSNKKFKYLDLGNNPLTDEAADQIVAIIKNNEELQYLNLSNCKFEPYGMKKVVLVLKTCTSLKYINLTYNTVGDELADEIAAVIDNNEELVQVYLPNNVFNNKCINDSFKKKGSLKKANLRSNQVAIVKLENLVLKFEIIYNHLIFKSLTSGIKYLFINFNFVPEQALQLLIDYLNSNSYLEHVELAVSGLTEAVVCRLCEALCSFESLRYLSICCSDITVEAASSLADVFDANKNNLHHIILHNCTLNGVNLQKLCDALINVSNLKSIDLSFNNFDYVAVSQIGKLITKSLFVEHLDLSNCWLKRADVTRILKTLTRISELKYLNLSNNKMPYDASTAIAAVTSTNLYLKHENIKIGMCSKM